MTTVAERVSEPSPPIAGFQCAICTFINADYVSGPKKCSMCDNVNS
jgi:hypothetical protein